MVLTKTKINKIPKFSNIKNYQMLLIILLLSLSLSVVLSNNTQKKSNNTATTEKPETTFVVFLNQTTFENFNATTDCYFLEFFEPWCGHCKSLKPIYEKTAKQAEEKGLSCKFAAVQAGESPQLTEAWGVKGYPSIFFVNNKKNEKFEYKGQRTEKDFINYLIAKSKDLELSKIPSDLVSEEALLSKFFSKIESENKNNYLIMLGKEDLVANKFAKLMKLKDFMIMNFQHVYYFEVNEQNVALAQKVFNSLNKNENGNLNLNISEEVYVFSRLYIKSANAFEEFELLNLTENEWANANLIKNALMFYKFPAFGNATEELISYALETGTNNLVIFYDDGLSASAEAKSNKTEAEKAQANQLEIEKLISAGKFLSEELKSDVKKLISENNLRKEFIISYSTLKNPAVNILVDVLKFKKEYLPIFLLTKSKEDSEEDLDKYMKNKSLLDKATVFNFINDFKQNNLKKFLTSDELPAEKTDKDGVLKIVGLNFDEFLLNNEQDIALFVCSKFSKNCKKFAPILSNVAQIFENNTNLLIGLTDPNYNEYAVDVQPVYPSLVFLPRSEAKLSVQQRFKNSVLFDGEINTKNLKEFILQNTRFKLALNPIGNETLIHASEIKPENLVKPIKADEGPEAEADFEYESMFSEFAGNSNEFGDLLKSFGGGNAGMGGLGGQGGEMPDLSAFKEMFGKMGDSGLDMDKLKQMEDLEIDDESLTEEEKMEKIKKLMMAGKIPEGGFGSGEEGSLGDLGGLGDMMGNMMGGDEEYVDDADNVPLEDNEESNPKDFEQQDAGGNEGNLKQQQQQENKDGDSEQVERPVSEDL